MHTTNLTDRRRLPHLETAFPGPAIEPQSMKRPASPDERLTRTANHLLAGTVRVAWYAMKGLVKAAFRIPRLFARK